MLSENMFSDLSLPTLPLSDKDWFTQTKIERERERAIPHKKHSEDGQRNSRKSLLQARNDQPSSRLFQRGECVGSAQDGGM